MEGSVELPIAGLDGCELSLRVDWGIWGAELLRRARRQLPKVGGVLHLSLGDAKLLPQQSLREALLRRSPALRGDEGRDEGRWEEELRRTTCVFTYSCTNLLSAWSGLQGRETEDGLEGITDLRYEKNCIVSLLEDGLPASLTYLKFGDEFDQCLQGITLPSGLQTLELGEEFRRSMQGVTLPGLRSLSFGKRFNQSLESMALLNLRSLSFGHCFNQSLDGVALPSLQHLNFGDAFNQPLQKVDLPSLQSLKFGRQFNRSLKGVELPNLQNLTFGHCFSQSLQGVELPMGLESLSFGQIESLASQEDVALDSDIAWPQGLRDLKGANFTAQELALPSGLQNLSFGRGFNQPLQSIALPALQSLTLGFGFDQSLTGVSFPETLRSLTLGHSFNQALHGAVWPASLRILAIGDSFNQAMQGVTLPEGLQDLIFGRSFNRPLQMRLPRDLKSLEFHGYNQDLALVWPEQLQSLRLGNCFNQSLTGLPQRLQTLELGSEFNQSLQGTTWPFGLEHLQFGTSFNQRLQEAALPSSLRSLKLGRFFNQNLQGVTFSGALQSLTFSVHFDQRLQGVKWPPNLQSLTFGHCFDQSFQGVVLPSGLQQLKFGHRFNQSLQGVLLPSNLQSLSFGNFFNQPLQEVSLPDGLQSLTFGVRFNQPLQDAAFSKSVTPKMVFPVGSMSSTQSRERTTKLPTLLGAKPVKARDADKTKSEKSEHKCKDYFGRWHSVKDLRDRRNAAVLKGMRWMHKFLTADRNMALIEIGDDAACIFFEIWYTSSSSILRGAARGIAQDLLERYELHLLQPSRCACKFCHGKTSRTPRGKALFFELMYLIRCKDEMGLEASAMLSHADALWRSEGLEDTEKLFGVRQADFHKVSDSDWVVLIMNIMILEFNQLLFPRRWPIRWGLKETFDFVRGHRFCGPPYDRSFRFHDSFYFVTHIAFAITAYSAIKMNPKDVPWLYNYNRRACLYWVKMARYRESSEPQLLVDIDGLSEAMDVLRGCGLTDGGDRLLCSATLALLDLQQSDGSWPYWVLHLKEVGSLGEPLACVSPSPNLYEQIHPTWVAVQSLRDRNFEYDRKGNIKWGQYMAKLLKQSNLRKLEHKIAYGKLPRLRARSKASSSTLPAQEEDIWFKMQEAVEEEEEEDAEELFLPTISAEDGRNSLDLPPKSSV
ncbi:unnamed protein product [Effrenium voratum]|nr:unnamed protein product [Effrenium voratum]